MAEFEIIDCHCHAYPNRDLGMAWQRTIGYANPKRTGDIEEIFTYQDQAGVTGTNVLCHLPLWQMYRNRLPQLPAGPQERAEADRQLGQMLARRLVHYNTWAAQVCRQYPGRLTFFCGIEPRFMDQDTLVSEVGRSLRSGASGIKMVPVLMHLHPNDPRLFPVYEVAEQWGVPVLSQSGGTAHGDDETPWGHPRYFEEPLQAFPQLNFILAHLGIGAEGDVIRLTAKYPNLFADTSHRLHRIGTPRGWSPAEAVALFRRIGTDRVLFGTNYPLNDPAKYVRVLQALPLMEEERRQIAAENFKRLISHRTTAHQEIKHDV